MTDKTKPMVRLDPAAHELGVTVGMLRWWIRELALVVHRANAGQTAAVLLDRDTIEALRAHLTTRQKPPARGGHVTVVVAPAPKAGRAPRPRLKPPGGVAAGDGAGVASHG